MGFVETAFAVRGFLGDIPRFCSRCKKKIEIKIFEGGDGNFTEWCGCGTTTYRMNIKDEGHPQDYYSKTFIPEGAYKKGNGQKSDSQKLGFETTQKSGKIILKKNEGSML